MRRRAGRALLGLAALTTAFAVAPATAQAATGYARCPSNYYCIFADTGGGGVYGYLQRADGNLADGNGVQGMNNTTESVWNRTGQYLGLYNYAGYDGLLVVVAPGYKGNLPTADRNKVTSLCRTTNTGNTCT